MLLVVANDNSCNILNGISHRFRKYCTAKKRPLSFLSKNIEVFYIDTNQCLIIGRIADCYLDFSKGKMTCFMKIINIEMSLKWATFG